MLDSSSSFASYGSRLILFRCAVERPVRLLKDSGPSAISVELTNLAPEGGGSSGLLLAFVRMIDSMLTSGRDFDLAHSYLALFLKVSVTIRISQKGEESVYQSIALPLTFDLFAFCPAPPSLAV